MIPSRPGPWHGATMLRLVTLLLLSAPALADAPKVKSASLARDQMGWTVTVTLRHPDTGWDHFANGWAVELPDGTQIGYRELSHPHTDEQPFTRWLRGVDIPAGTPYVMIRPRCSLVGWSSAATRVDVPAATEGGAVSSLSP